jgi:hypothetical protein
MIVRAAGQIDNHGKASLQFLVHGSKPDAGSAVTQGAA